MLPNDATPTPTLQILETWLAATLGTLQIIFGHGAARLNRSFPVIPTGLHQLPGTNEIWEMEEMEIYRYSTWMSQEVRING